MSSCDKGHYTERRYQYSPEMRDEVYMTYQPDNNQLRSIVASVTSLWQFRAATGIAITTRRESLGRNILQSVPNNGKPLDARS